MLSQNVAKTTVPSYYMIRTNLPHRKPQNQWEGVYYYSGITKRQQHVILLQRKRERQAALAAFQASRNTLCTQYERQHAQKQAPASSPYQLALGLAQHGMTAEAAQLFDRMHHNRELTIAQYTGLLSALAADQLRSCVLVSEAACDPALTFKRLGDAGGEERASEAYRWHEMAQEVLRTEMLNANGKTPKGGMLSRAEHTAAATQLTNALMRALMSCGYSHVKAVSNAVYDSMGLRGISPTMTTYECVMLSLALQGNTAEAEDVLRFVQQHHGEHVTINGFNALLLGFREERAFDRCDQVWQEVFDRRWPRANALTAELYLRSIIDHSYTPTSEPLQRFGNINVVEKKKVPIVLTQMDELGIPRVELSRPLLDEVEDALRKFSIYRNRFYEWGRAVKQFDFIEFRRRNGWMYDLHMMKHTTKTMPPVRDPTQPDATLAGIATAEIPAFFNEQQPWERSALEDVLNVTDNKEKMGDVRGGDIYYDDVRSVHERSSVWMTEVPETRYDKLYGVNHPNIAKMGIRRHLEVEYANRSEVLDRDAAIVRKSMSHGRRLRKRIEPSRTHRNEGSLTPES